MAGSACQIQSSAERYKVWYICVSYKVWYIYVSYKVWNICMWYEVWYISVWYKVWYIYVMQSFGPMCLPGVEVSDCPSLNTPPREIQSRGTSAIIAYMQRLQSGSLQCKRTKLMLVGLGGAGKTRWATTGLWNWWNFHADFSQFLLRTFWVWHIAVSLFVYLFFSLVKAFLTDASQSELMQEQDITDGNQLAFMFYTRPLF